MIIRRRHTANYTTIGNALFDDMRLAADEVGILAYLLSRPHDWEVRRPALMRRWNMGREAIKRVITSLVRCGWCLPCRTRLPNGTYHMIYEIRDEPGASLTDDEVRRVLSLVSSEAAPDEIGGNSPSDVVPGTDDPPTGYPSLADPALGEPYVDKLSIQNNEIPRKDSDQKIEREGERAKQKHASNLAEFKRRYPDVASDDQTRIDTAWSGLSLEGGEAAIAGIPEFFEGLKRSGRSKRPAAFTYLEQRRWTLLKEAANSVPRNPTSHTRDSVEAKALGMLFRIIGATGFFHSVHYQRADGIVTYPKEVTPQLAALAQAGPEDGWAVLDHRQAGSWEAFLRKYVTLQVRKRLVAGDRAPWPWAPSIEGKLYPAGSDPPDILMTEQDQQDFR